MLVDLKPTGKYYMEDFHRAGGVPAVLRELGSLINRDVLTVTGRTLGEELDDARSRLPAGHHLAAVEPDLPAGQRRGAPWEPGSGWGDYQAGGGVPRVACTLRAGCRVRERR